MFYTMYTQDKLYDLMTMGFKYQILSCTSPVQLLNVTLVHLESLKVLCASSICNDIIGATISKFIETYSGFSDMQWLEIKFELLRFMQDKKVKVSLFLQQEMQLSNGELTICPSKRLPYGAEQPGKVLWYDRGMVVGRQSIGLPWPDNPNDLEVNTNIIDSHATAGKNMFLKDMAEDLVYDKHSFEECIRALHENAPYVSSSSQKGTLGRSQSKEFVRPRRIYDSKVSAKAELSLLSDLLGAKSPAKSAKDDSSELKPLKLNLFPSSSAFSKEDDSGDADDEEYYRTGMITIDIDGASDAKTMTERLKDLDFNDDDETDTKAEGKARSDGDEDDEDDLLALMDSAK